MIGIRPEEMRSLAAPRTAWCVSIYMPLHGSQRDSQQDVIRLKNLVNQADEMLAARGMRRPEIDAFLEEARALEGNGLFWRFTGKKGLALLIEPKTLRWIRSQVAFEESVAVENRYHLAPLVQAFCKPERLLILALSGNSVRLYQSEESRLTPIQLPEPFPTSLSEATKGTEFDRGLSYHTSAAHGRGTVRVGIQTGHGTPKDDQKTLVTEYVRSVVKHLEPVLRHESSPLVLVAVHALHPVFRELCRYPYLLEEGVMASPDSLTDSELHRRAIEAAGPNRHANLQAALERYRQMQRTDRIAYHIEQILPAIEHGRVDVLFAASDAHIWGTSDNKTGVAVHRVREAHDVDLLDLAICKTIEHGRTAYVIDAQAVPSHEPLAAILKW